MTLVSFSSWLNTPRSLQNKDKGKGKATLHDVEGAGGLGDDRDDPDPAVACEKVGKGVLGVEDPVPVKMVVKFARPQTKVRRVARSTELGDVDHVESPVPAVSTKKVTKKAARIADLGDVLKSS